MHNMHLKGARARKFTLHELSPEEVQVKQKFDSKVYLLTLGLCGTVAPHNCPYRGATLRCNAFHKHLGIEPSGSILKETYLCFYQLVSYDSWVVDGRPSLRFERDTESV